MDAKKCDRCGGYYDYDPKVNIGIEFDGVEYDLCPGCVDLWYDFINGVPIKGFIKVTDS